MRNKKNQFLIKFPISFQLEDKSDFGNRIKEIISGDHVKAFTRKGGLPESSIRSYILNQKRPGADSLIGISLATGTTIDWLATGMGFKYVKDLRKAQKMFKEADPQAIGRIPDVLEAYRRRLDTLHEYLAQIGDENDRSRIIEDIISRVEELKRVGELEHEVRELRAAFNKKN